MTEVSRMTLKILYTLDNGSSGTYLARSKKPQQVTIITIPNPNSPSDCESSSFRIGAVDLSSVLQEIYLNSPELLNHNVTKNGHDYNLYYRDICEVDEPLVSLGLFSEIRHQIRKQLGEEGSQIGEGYDEEAFLVTGRVCSNFAALLKRSYSNSCSNSSDNSEFASPDTLEVKLRFIRVVTDKKSRRASNTVSTLPRTPLSVQTQSQQIIKPNCVARSSKIIRPVKSTITKRQMNPTPAPKAERTQSLPIWNPKPTPHNTAFPANSIAHKIYLADRKTDAAQQANSQQPLAYQINALQQDNTIQKFKVDDAVSKRFDFMLNKKRKPQSEQRQHHDKAQIVSKKPAAAKAQRFNTMAGIPVAPIEAKPITARVNPKKRQRCGSAGAGSLTSSVDENSIFDQLIAGESKKEQGLGPIEENKENEPPQDASNQHFDLDLLSFPDINIKSDMEWFGEYNPFNSPSLIQNILLEQSSKPNSTTPRDPNTCNTISMEGAEAEEQHSSLIEEHAKVSSDNDRTSPIDTLSMPLMELNDRTTTRLVSCQEQLRRIPLLGHQMKGEISEKVELNKGTADDQAGEDNDEDEVTSIVMQLSSSSEDMQLPVEKNVPLKRGASSQNSSPLLNGRHYNNQGDCEEDEDEIRDKIKKQRAMPSSPTTMFNYQDDLSSNGDSSDLFSSFIRSRPIANNDADSTPATQYENQSSDHLKQ